MTNREKIEKMSGEELTQLIAEGMGWEKVEHNNLQMWKLPDNTFFFDFTRQPERQHNFDPLISLNQAILIVAAHFEIILYPPNESSSEWTAFYDGRDLNFSLEWDNANPRQAICRCAGLIILERGKKCHLMEKTKKLNKNAPFVKKQFINPWK